MQSAHFGQRRVHRGEAVLDHVMLIGRQGGGLLLLAFRDGNQRFAKGGGVS
jgi:hypothetical protein